MKKLLGTALLILLTMMLVALVGGATIAEGADDTKGQETFLAQKCNMCHSVPSASIEGKVKSESMKGPNLPTADLAGADRDALLKYVRKEADFNGKTHKKGAKATDEELNVVLDWLVAQPVAESN